MKYLALLAVACGSGPAPTTAHPPSPDTVKQFLGDVLAGIQRSDPETFTGRVDVEALFLGSSKSGVALAPEFVEAHRKMFASGKPGAIQITSHDLRATVAPDGKSAWFSNLMTWTIDGDVRDMRWTGVVENVAGKWQLRVSDVSRGVPNEDAAKHTDAPAPMPGGPDNGPGQPDAQPLLATFDADLASIAQWSKDISDRADAYVIGSDPKEIWDGPAAIRKAFDDDAQHRATLARDGAARAHLAGQLGWIAANVRVTVGPATFPLRLLAVYLHEGAGWKMVQLHAASP
jgi:hypothetical protein